MTETRYRAKYLVSRDGTIGEDVIFAIEDGRITSLDNAGRADVDLGDSLVAPGLVNAHSHAFQRSIRCRTEWMNAEAPEDDFWSWRDRMYTAALSFDEASLYQASRLAFEEMAASGITTVGEFHYVHHQPDGSPYADRNRLSHLVVEAARDVGLRICLLLVAYHRAGFERAPDPKQRRFIEDDCEVYLDRYRALTERFSDDPMVSVGMAPHSIRAVPRPWLEAIAAEAGEATPVHIHACEQRRELEESMAEYGASPLALLEDCGLFERNLTLIHATHLSDADLEMLAESDVRVCACPTTERNLGDGFLPAAELVERDVDICLGSDSHTNIDLFEEMRLVEYHERLRYEQRNVLSRIAFESGQLDERDGRVETERVLWPMGTHHGASSLGLDHCGALDVGSAADFFVVDLDHISLRGAERGNLLSHVVFSMPWTAVTQTWVGGVQIH